MNNSKIYIKIGNSWQQLDVGEDIVVINKNITDVMDLTKRRGDYTKTIKLKGTSNNNLLLAQAFEINADKLFNTKTGVECEIWRGENLELKGRLYLLSINDTYHQIEYECIAVSTLKDIYDKLSTLKLSDLYASDTIDFTDAHILQQDFTNILLSNVYPFYWIYGKFGHYHNSPYYHFKNFKPSVFVLDILKRAFNQIGYSIDSSSVIYDTSKIEHKIFQYLLLVGKENWYGLDEATINGNTMNVYQSSEVQLENYVPSTFYITYVQPSQSHNLQANTEVSDVGNHWNNTTNQISYTLPFSLKCNMYFKVEVEFVETIFTLPSSFTANFCTFNFSIDNQIHNLSFACTFNRYAVAGNVHKYRAFIYLNVNKIFNPVLNKNITVKFNFDLNIIYSLRGAVSAFRLYEMANTSIQAQPTSYVFGSTGIPAAAFLPDVNVGDFIANFIKMFNLFYSFPTENVIKFDDYFSFYSTNANNVVDISKFVDERSKQQVIISDYINRSIHYKYDNNDGYLHSLFKSEVDGRVYGDALIDTGFEVKKEKKDVDIKMVVPAAELDDVVVTSYYDYDASANTYKPVDYSAMLLLYNGLLTASYSLQAGNPIVIDTDGVNSSTNQNAISALPIATHLWVDKSEATFTMTNEYAHLPDFDLSLDTPVRVYYALPSTQVTMRNVWFAYHYRWWQNFIDKNSIIYKVKVVIPSYQRMPLNAIYYFDNAYWLLLKVSDWNISTNLATCEFVKIIDTSVIEFTRRVVGGGLGQLPRHLASEVNTMGDTFAMRQADTGNNTNISSDVIFVDFSQINPSYTIIIESPYVIGVAAFVISGFDQLITVNINGRSDIVQNANDYTFIAKPKTTGTSTTTITLSSTLSPIRGSVIINAIKIL